MGWDRTRSFFILQNKNKNTHGMDQTRSFLLCKTKTKTLMG